MESWGKEASNWSSGYRVLGVLCVPLTFLGCSQTMRIKGCLGSTSLRVWVSAVFPGALLLPLQHSCECKGVPGDGVKAYRKGNGSLSTVPGTS